MVLRVLSTGDLCALATSGLAHRELSALLSTPAVVVEPDDKTSDAAADRAPLLASLPCVLIGLPGVPGALVDVTATDRTEATMIAERIANWPNAAVTLALLLRGGAARSIDEGLVAESMAYSVLQSGSEFGMWRAARPPRERAPDPEPPVLAQRDGDVLRITLNRPHVHNAFSAGMRDALLDALSIATADPSIERIVLAGNGKSFCSGGDLDEFAGFDDPATAHLARLTASAGHLLAMLAMKMEVRLHGACLGAGIELPALARRVTADADTVIGLPELSLGLVPGAGGTVSLPRRIGRHRTAWLALTGAWIDAATAQDWGLVDELS